MRLLHFRRTFAQKLFAIHSKVEIPKRDARPLGKYARHHDDLFQLLGQPEAEMLNSTRYADIKTEYDQRTPSNTEVVLLTTARTLLICRHSPGSRQTSCWQREHDQRLKPSELDLTSS